MYQIYLQWDDCVDFLLFCFVASLYIKHNVCMYADVRNFLICISGLQ